MTEYIKKDEVIRILKSEWSDKCGDDAMQDSIDRIAALPTADVREDKRGEWIEENGPDAPGRFQCDNCRRIVLRKERFCPSCGSHNGKDVGDGEDGRKGSGDEREAEIPAGQGWIPTEKANPEKDGGYVCTIDGEICGEDEPFVGMAWYENGKWEEDTEDYKAIIAWRDDIRPYREGGR